MEKGKSRGSQLTFLSVLHGVTRNRAVSRAGGRQPAEDHGGAASLLSNGAVRGRRNTFGDGSYGQMLFLPNLTFCTQVEHFLGNVLPHVSIFFYALSTQWHSFLQALERPGRYALGLEVLPQAKDCTLDIRLTWKACRKLWWATDSP